MAEEATDNSYNLKATSFPPDILKEHLMKMYQTNDERITKKDPTTNSFNQREPAELVFSICSQLKLNDEIKFISIELFNNFMIKQFPLILDHMERKNKTWEVVFDSMKKQLFLRMLSCIQIANKLHSNHFILTLKKVQQILEDLGEHHELDAILDSEIKVLKALNFKLHIETPYQYMELLLEVLANNQSDIDASLLHSAGVKILECFYYAREEIVPKLYQFYSNNNFESIDKNDESYKWLENNYLYLASSVIMCAALLIEKERSELYKKLLEEINSISNIDADDIDKYAQVLYDYVMQ